MIKKPSWKAFGEAGRCGEDVVELCSTNLGILLWERGQEYGSSCFLRQASPAHRPYWGISIIRAKLSVDGWNWNSLSLTLLKRAKPNWYWIRFFWIQISRSLVPTGFLGQFMSLRLSHWFIAAVLYVAFQSEGASDTKSDPNDYANCPFNSCEAKYGNAFNTDRPREPAFPRIYEAIKP